MTFAKINDDGKTMAITQGRVTITLDYDEAKEVRTVLTKFTNDNYYTNQFLPCRKCGKQPVYGGRYGHRKVECTTCGVSMEDCFPHKLAQKWNKYNSDNTWEY